MSKMNDQFAQQFYETGAISFQEVKWLCPKKRGKKIIKKNNEERQKEKKMDGVKTLIAFEFIRVT